MSAAAPGRAAPPPGPGPAAAEPPWPLLLGVRHHGPGSARAVRAALDACEPDAVLIEGPSEADALVGFAVEEGMRPPVALLAHAVGDPGQAAFWPLAEFSPEWVAIQWALSRGVPVRFIDLPAANSLAMAARTGAEGEAETEGTPGPAAEAGAARTAAVGTRAGAGARRSQGDLGETARAASAAPTGRLAGPDGTGASGDAGAVPGAADPPGQGGPAGAVAAADPGDLAWPGGAGHRPDAGAMPGARGPQGQGGPERASHRGGVAPVGRVDLAGAGDPAGLDGAARLADVARAVAVGGVRDEVAEGDPAGRLRVDPLAVLAGAAGYDEPERWWEDVVEHRGLAPGAGDATGADSTSGADTMSGAGAAVGAGRSGGADGLVGAGGPGGAGGSARGGRSAGKGGAEGAVWAGGFGGAGGSDGAGGAAGAVGAGVGAGAVASFAALGEAMAALRAEYGHGGHEHDAAREAQMRMRLREARREFGERIAVVCGAWHVPALAERTTVTADRGLLKGLPKVKVELSWVPWTHRRLARHSGYGAGITSPGWYSHLFHAADRPLERWLTKVAGLLRAEDFAVSSAHVIEAVRLAETLAAMRGRPLAGLAETMDAVRAVMCEGSDVPLALVHDRLVVGDVLGEVPESAPATPLQRDLARTQRSLRLKPEALDRELELDLRKDNDAARSRLLHRLRLLGVDWGTPAASRGSTGTFRETWRLRWEPELSVRVAEAGVWGTTVLSAATTRAEAKAVDATALGEVTDLAERCLLAALPDALPVVMRALADRAALDADVGHLAHALPALVRSVRYGDVRGTDTAALAEVAVGLAERVLVGLPPACFGLDVDGAAEMRGHMEAVHQSVGLLADIGAGGGERGEAGPADPGSTADPGSASGAGGRGAVGLRGRWLGVLRVLAGHDGVSGLIRGRAARLLLDDGRLAEGEAARLMGLVLSPGTAPAEAASWIEGFVGGAGGAGGGMLLVHDERLLGLLDSWLTGVPAEAFTDVLPLLRRTFAAYDAGVRRTLGELVRRGPAAADGGVGPVGGPPAPGFGPGLDEGRVAAALPTVRLLLGLDDGHPGHSSHDNHASEGAG